VVLEMLRPGDATAAAVFTVAFAISLLETPGDGNRSARHSGVTSECRRVSARPAGASLHGAANGGTGDAAAEAGPAARELQQARAGAGRRRCSSEHVHSWRVRGGARGVRSAATLRPSPRGPCWGSPGKPGEASAPSCVCPEVEDEADEWGPPGSERSCGTHLSEREKRGVGQGQ